MSAVIAFLDALRFQYASKQGYLITQFAVATLPSATKVKSSKFHLS